MEPDSEQAPKTERKPFVLAVDDAPVILKSITFALKKDYEVFTLTDPTMVEKFLNQITPDIFLLDYRMPELNGFELIPIIRSFEKHKNTPIIFLTSMGTNDYVADAIKLGACDYMIKPFKEDVLREKVAKHIARTKSS